MALLTLRGLTKRFGGLPAVDGIDLDVDTGEIVALIGPNGAGKTTLLSLVAGIVPPTACTTFRFGDRDLVGAAVHEVRHAGIGTVRQAPTRFPSMSVREEVAVGARFGRAETLDHRTALHRADEVLDLVGLREQAAAPVTSLTLHGTRLLGLARALAGRPDLLLLDEPMAGLTPGELEHAIALIRALRDEHGLTVLWVEHVMPAVDLLAERVVVMDVGRVLAEGDPAEVRRDPAVIAAYLGVPDAGPAGQAGAPGAAPSEEGGPRAGGA